MGWYWSINKEIQKNGIVASIDLPFESGLCGYTVKHEHLYELFAQGNQKVVLQRSSSHEESTKVAVQGIFNHEPIDVLFIDGDHSYEGVKKDFELYEPLVKKGGLICFHDICDHKDDINCKVNAFYNQVKQSYKYYDFIENIDQGWAGIGVLIKKSKKMVLLHQ